MAASNGFGPPPRARLEETLRAYAPQAAGGGPELWPAAVLLMLYEHEGDLHTVFQKRTDRVDTHKGQISLPGGGIDPGDRDLVHTALRETHEEIGVDPAHVEVLGQLDQVRTISNFLVTPYVGWLSHYPYGWVTSASEVAYLLEVPMAHLSDPATFVPDRRQINGREHVLPSYRFGDDLIWGVTGRIVANFVDLYRAARG